MEDHLKEFNLNSEKFIKLLKEENITTTEELQKKSEDESLYEKLLSNASDKEEGNLKKMFKIDDESENEKESRHDDQNIYKFILLLL